MRVSAIGLGAAAIAAFAAMGASFVACSSASSGGASGVDAGSDGSAQDAAVDSASDGGITPGDGSHDGPSPDALYAACAITGSFGAPCHATTTGADPTDCTDPSYPVCFVGGQGSWCTKACTGNGDCAQMEDAGCVPTQCNGRGYCK
jgi:hypothetical protein